MHERLPIQCNLDACDTLSPTNQLAQHHTNHTEIGSDKIPVLQHHNHICTHNAHNTCAHSTHTCTNACTQHTTTNTHVHTHTKHTHTTHMHTHVHKCTHTTHITHMHTQSTQRTHTHTAHTDIRIHVYLLAVQWYIIIHPPPFQTQIPNKI